VKKGAKEGTKLKNFLASVAGSSLDAQALQGCCSDAAEAFLGGCPSSCLALAMSLDIIMKKCGAPTATHTNCFQMAMTGSNPLAAVNAPASFALKTPHQCWPSSTLLMCTFDFS
jgi:hypothetical protein